MNPAPAVRILVVEDEQHLADGLRFNLEAEGYRVQVVDTGEAALELLQTDSPDVVVLDIMLPGKDGFTVMSELRQAGQFIPTLMLTARGHPEDVLKGFGAGADDYLTKPFGLRELIARLNAIARRIQTEPEDEPEVLRAGEIEMDLHGHSVRRSGETLHLTPKEFELLAFLMKNEGSPVGHTTLLRTIWGPSYGNESHYLRSYVKTLRKKIEVDPARPEYILTEPRIGYRFANPSAEAETDAIEELSSAESVE